MSSVGSKGVIIQDSLGGDAVTVTNSRLDVNAVLSSSDNIEIGNVDIKLNGTGVSADEGNADAGTIRVTIADDDNHWGAVGTASDKDGVAHGQLRYIGESVEDIGAIYSNSITMNGHLVDINTNTVNTANFVIGMQDTHGSILGTVVVPAGAESKVVDGDTLDNPVAEGKATRVAASRSGIQYMCLTDQLGLIAHPNATDGTAQDATPGILNVGGEYRASPATYTDGDATILQTNINGALNIAGTVDLGSTDNAVLDAMVVDLAAMEALLITIDSDTDAIKTAVEILDDWDDSNYANVNINSAGTDITNTTSGKLDVTIHSSDGSAITDSAGKLNIQIGGQAADVTVAHNITGIASDDNPTVGTSAEQLITDGADGATACKRVDIMAHPSNTGYIWVGDSAVSVDGLNGGIRLAPGDFYSMDIDNTGDIYVIATEDGENVCYNYFT